MKSGIELIAQERKEQIEKHGYTTKKDIKNNDEGQLVEAIKKLITPFITIEIMENGAPKGWDKERWQKMAEKPYKERLAICGAWCAAEIDIEQYAF